ncbi:hypothetical protein VOLCADRAFT_64280 [Volvox carteri f. nagariensis]|uniref:Uncharacterized protein n=1 Tax=Volvox carteri f. nagariensis TaxID=3068 RepID=D8U5N8_VOLCA|nr:uncharacterized protein VOLCADRAFT_64280 [Volvox carteri f. nagariensis]EFJ44952.1 hypothetical protein VOLCADRAFT_64280 [Volvox carteri f. nagariensis]|eukprot:XP_002953923.1 hypothetical protein VOLCADRAFT_64280 [Volvox carteri f. nagariensis]
MISAVSWIPRGVAKAVPTVAQPTEEEMEAMRAQIEAEGEGEDDDEDDAEASETDSDNMDSDDPAKDEPVDEAVARARAVASAMASSRAAGGGKSSAGTGGLEDAMRELDMDHYDDAGDDDADVINRVLGTSGRARLEYAAGEDDPYLKLGDDDSEIEDFTLRPTDLIILSAKNEDDVSNLEVWVYEEADASGEANLYVHHEVLLPAFPLCVSWLDCDPGGDPARRNLVAVGTLEPAIEIWDLDVVDTVEPVLCLGGEKKKKKKKKKKASKPKLQPGSHEDSVLGLSWNREYRNVLASGSADCTVKVWDLVKGVCEHTLRCHTDKVQAVAWNPAESPVLLTGSFDRSVCLADARTPQGDPARWRVSADVEALCWNPHDPTCFLVSSEDGIVAHYDARKGAGGCLSDASLFRLSAHDKPACTLSFCPAVRGLLATGSTDKKVKLWDLAGNAPHLVCTQDLNTGAVFSAAFCGDAPYLLAAGGAGGEVVVWDVRAHSAVAAKYPAFAATLPAGASQQEDD